MKLDNNHMFPSGYTVAGIHDELDKKYKKDFEKLAKKVPARCLCKRIEALEDWYEGGDGIHGRSLRFFRQFAQTHELMDLQPETYDSNLYRGIGVYDGRVETLPLGSELSLRLHNKRKYASTSLCPSIAYSFGNVLLQVLEPVVPVVAPPQYTKEWFNEVLALALEEDTHRQKEQEVIVYAPKAVKVKRLPPSYK